MTRTTAADVALAWLGVVVVFTAGAVWGGRHTTDLVDALKAQRATIQALKAGHTSCQTVIGRLSAYIEHQEQRLDALEHGDPVAEAEAILEREGGS